MNEMFIDRFSIFAVGKLGMSYLVDIAGDSAAGPQKVQVTMDRFTMYPSKLTPH